MTNHLAMHTTEHNVLFDQFSPQWKILYAAHHLCYKKFVNSLIVSVCFILLILLSLWVYSILKTSMPLQNGFTARKKLSKSNNEQRTLNASNYGHPTLWWLGLPLTSCLNIINKYKYYEEDYINLIKKIQTCFQIRKYR